MKRSSRAIKTQRDYIYTAGRFLEHAGRREGQPLLTIEGMKPKVPARPAADEREQFSLAEIEVLVRNVLNYRAKQSVPIPTALVNVGFVDFLIAAKKNVKHRPFEAQWQPHRSRDGLFVKWSHAITKWVVESWTSSAPRPNRRQHRDLFSQPAAYLHD